MPEEPASQFQEAFCNWQNQEIARIYALGDDRDVGLEPLADRVRDAREFGEKLLVELARSRGGADLRTRRVMVSLYWQFYLQPFQTRYGRDIPDPPTVNTLAQGLLRVVLAVALHDEDVAWAEAFCEQFAQHPHPGVRGNALLGFGHLARRFRKLDAARVQPLLEAGLTDLNQWVRGQSEAAAMDAEFFLGWRLQRPQQGG